MIPRNRFSNQREKVQFRAIIPPKRSWIQNLLTINRSKSFSSNSVGSTVKIINHAATIIIVDSLNHRLCNIYLLASWLNCKTPGWDQIKIQCNVTKVLLGAGQSQSKRKYQSSQIRWLLRRPLVEWHRKKLLWFKLFCLASASRFYFTHEGEGWNTIKCLIFFEFYEGWK